MLGLDGLMRDINLSYRKVKIIKLRCKRKRAKCSVDWKTGGEKSESPMRKQFSPGLRLLGLSGEIGAKKNEHEGDTERSVW